MNLLKIGAVVVGGIVVLFVLDAVFHAIVTLFIALAFVAIVGGGGYAAYKVFGGGHRRELR